MFMKQIYEMDQRLQDPDKALFGAQDKSQEVCESNSWCINVAMLIFGLFNLSLNIVLLQTNSIHVIQ